MIIYYYILFITTSIIIIIVNYKTFKGKFAQLFFGCIMDNINGDHKKKEKTSRERGIANKLHKIGPIHKQYAFDRRLWNQFNAFCHADSVCDECVQYSVFIIFLDITSCSFFFFYILPVSFENKTWNQWFVVGHEKNFRSSQHSITIINYSPSYFH